MRQLLLTIVIGFITLIVGCQQFDAVPPSDIVSTNRNRKQIGIRQISSRWSFYIREFGCEKWKDGDLLSKIVQRTGNEDENSILWEQDYYYGRGKLTDPDGVSTREMVSILYDYSNSKFFIAYVGENTNAQSIVGNLTITDQGYAGASNKSTLATADQLLGLIQKRRLSAIQTPAQGNSKIETNLTATNTG